jgi:GNAT superfamily N-acetyltransferase
MKIKMVDASLSRVAETIQRMHAECFPKLDKYTELHGDWWIAYDPMPVAFAGLQASVRTEGAGYLCRAGVLPHGRGKGYQRKLIKTREREALSKGWVQLFSDTDPVNAHSMNNLINCGFRAFRPTVMWSSKGADWVYWRKVISRGVA